MAEEVLPKLPEEVGSAIQRLNDWTLSSLEATGGVFRLLARAVRGVFGGGFELGPILEQVEAIGVQSTTVAALTAIFTGMVETVQFALQMSRFGAKEYVGNVVSLSIVRELGPVLTALMVGGRVGAGIAAELGSMNVTEQVDALRSMGADPVKKLVVPRVVATFLVLPLLAAFSNVIGTAGGMLIAFVSEQIPPRYFYNASLQAVGLSDFLGGVSKTFVFAIIISVIACYQGLNATGGTEGVGRATTRTVVVCSITILVSDFILTTLLMAFGL